MFGLFGGKPDNTTIASNQALLAAIADTYRLVHENGTCYYTAKAQDEQQRALLEQFKAGNIKRNPVHLEGGVTITYNKQSKSLNVTLTA